MSMIRNWRSYFNRADLNRGASYYYQDRVLYVLRFGNLYVGGVEGREIYTALIKLDSEGKFEYMRCNCPMDSSGIRCKHLAAMCMAMEIGRNDRDDDLHDLEYVESLIEEVEFNHAKQQELKNYLYQQTGKKIEDKHVKEVQALMPYEGDEYHCFNLYELTKDLVVYDDVLKEAKQLVDEHIRCFNDPEISYNEYSKGNVLANFKMYTPMHANKVELSFTNEVIKTFTCRECGLVYETDYAFSHKNKEMCCHKVALLLYADDYIKKHNPGDNTDYSTFNIIKKYQSLVSKGIEQKSTGECLEELYLQPELVADDKQFKLVFHYGLEKLYKLRSITDIIDAVKHKSSLPLGTKNTVSFEEYSFRPISQAYYEFVKKAAKQQVDFSQCFKPLRSFTGLYTKDAICLGKENLDEFVDFMLEHPESKLAESVVCNGFKLTVVDAKLKLNLNISPEYDAMARFKGIVAKIRLPRVYCGDKYYYSLSKQELRRYAKEDFTTIEPLYGSEKLGVEMHVGSKNLNHFYQYVLPSLGENIKVKEIDAEIIRKHMSPLPNFTFMLDYDKDANNLLCYPNVSYGENSFELHHPYERTVQSYRHNENIEESFRDKVKERQVGLVVAKYFPDRNPGNTFVAESVDENVVRILDEGVDELLSLGEVNISDSFKTLRLKKKFKVSVGVRMESSLLDLEISSDDVSREELLEILNSYKRKKKFHRLKNGEYLKLNEDSLEDLSEMMTSMHITDKEFMSGKMHLPVYRTLYLDKLLEHNESLYVNRDANFRRFVKEFKTVNDSDFEVPDNLQGVMRPYQEFGYKWLRTMSAYNLGGILADDMGLGKTLQIISLLQGAKDAGEKGVSLVITPASLVYNWVAEFKRFAPKLKVLPIAGTQSERRELLKNTAEFDVLVTSYDLLKRDIAEYKDFNFAYEIIDEAQYIKTHTTAAAKSVKVVQSKHRFALTGTPIENRLSELWSIFDYLLPGFLYSYDNFRHELETPIVKAKDEDSVQRLKQLVGPFILRRLKQDVLKDLPDKLEEIARAKMDVIQQRLYDGQVANMQQLLNSTSDEEFNKSKIRILAEITKLRQICCDPHLIYDNYTGESTKLEAFVELVKSAIEGEHRMLVFSQFTSMLELIEERLQKEKIAYYKITGSTSKEQRLELVDSFNNDATPVFLISLKAGGTGLNLIGADMVIHYDPWWNVAATNQATDRAHRIGQTKVVNVYKLIAQDTIEEKILKLQETKRDLAESILNGDSINITQMTKEDLLELL